MNETLILLRTHFIDARVLSLARAYAAGGDYDVAIAVDETEGEIDTMGFPKLSMTLNSCVRLGLDVAQEDPLWRCGDYLFYHALQLPTRYRRFWSVEYDIAINLADPADLFRRLDAEASEDYLTTFLEVAGHSWVWRAAALKRFPVIYSSGFALVRLSAQAARELWRQRRFDAARPRVFDIDNRRVCINDETFVSSAIAVLGLKMADINQYGGVYDKTTLRRTGLMHPDDIPAPDGKIYHAVRTGASFLNAAASYYQFDVAAFLRRAEADLPEFLPAATAVIAQALKACGDDPLAVLGPQGALASALPLLADPRVAEALLRALARRRMRLCIEAIQFQHLPLDIGHSPAFDNLALGRVAWQSSVSSRVCAFDARRDAEGGVDGDTTVEYGFHTAYQERPWWTVDFGAVHEIAHVRLFNHKLYPRKARGLIVEGSTDFLTWRTWWAHDEHRPGTLTADPGEIALNPPRAARYLRLRLDRAGVLHLAEIEAIRA